MTDEENENEAQLLEAMVQEKENAEYKATAGEPLKKGQ